MDHDNDGTAAEADSLWRHLLQQDTSSNHALVLSLFQHVQELPALQAQCHAFTQQLRQQPVPVVVVLLQVLLLS